MPAVRSIGGYPPTPLRGRFPPLEMGAENLDQFPNLRFSLRARGVFLDLIRAKRARSLFGSNLKSA